ncbi:FecR domain-containing protein [bacterium]|nr:FecR domain-containing protein [bacterium]
MKEDIEYELLLRYLHGECDPAEESRVDQWLSADGENHALLERLAGVWAAPSPGLPAPDLEKAWTSVAQKAGLIEAARSESAADNVRPLGTRAAGWFTGGNKAGRWLRIAAAVALLALLPYWGGHLLTRLGPDYSAAELKEIRVEMGRMESVVLADGSRVTLEAGSIFRYPESFSGGERRVELEGEAYFEVAPDKEHPFEVRATGALVRVLGTKFDVRAWPQGSSVQVAVLEGAVSFSHDRLWRNGKVVVHGGQLSLMQRGDGISPPVEADIARQLGWLKREADFEGAPLSEVLACLERWYGVRFVLTDSSRLNERLTLQLDNQSLGSALELLALLTELQCEQKADTVYLSAGPDGKP